MVPPVHPTAHLAAIGAKLIGPQGSRQVDKNDMTLRYVTGSTEWPNVLRKINGIRNLAVLYM